MAAEANERVQRFVPGTVTVSFVTRDCARVALRDEWDVSTAPQLADALQRASRRRRNIVVDLAECTFVDSTTIGMLIVLARECTEGKGLAIALPPSQSAVDRAFALLGAREVLSVHSTFEDALRSLATVRAPTSNPWLDPSPPMPVD
jgi:anti-anti-sigma factor